MSADRPIKRPTAGGGERPCVNGCPDGLGNPKLEAKLDLYRNAVAQTFSPEVQEALRKIDRPALQLLALRRYIRLGPSLETKWVWSAQQLAEYEASPRGRLMSLEIKKVKEKFAELNPGYGLGTSGAHELARQVDLWNRNRIVNTAAEDLMFKCLREIALPVYPDLRKDSIADRFLAFVNLLNDAAVARFRAFLRQCEVHPEPTCAAPGTSDQGQMRAVDFVVLHGRQEIAGTQSRPIRKRWDEAGWTQKLKDAVKRSNSILIGPLLRPYQPWHYRLPD